MNDALVLLVLLWAALLVPSALRSRTGSPHATVGGFERAMDVLKSPSHRSGGRQLLVPGDASRIVDHVGIAPVEQTLPYKREDPRVLARRTWFTRLVLASVVSVVLAVVVGGLVWAAAAACLGATGVYIALLRRWKVQEDQVRSVVRRLEADAAPRFEQPVGAAVGESSVRLRRWDG